MANQGSTRSTTRRQSEDGLGASQPRSSRVVDRVKDTAAAQLNTQKGRAVEGMDTVAQAVRQATQQLRAEQHDTVAQYIEKGAEQLERFASRMRDKDAKDIVRDIEQFARRQPALFISGSFAVGVLAARFLRSSQDNDGNGTRNNAGNDHTTESVESVTHLRSGGY